MSVLKKILISDCKGHCQNSTKDIEQSTLLTLWTNWCMCFLCDGNYRAVGKINGEVGFKDSIKKFHRMKNEWKMAKIALIVIMLYVISWSPYSCVALTAFAGWEWTLEWTQLTFELVLWYRDRNFDNQFIYHIQIPVSFMYLYNRYILCLFVGCIYCCSVIWDLGQQNQSIFLNWDFKIAWKLNK